MPIMKRIVTLIITTIAACSMMSSSAQDIEAMAHRLLDQYPEARLLDIYKSCFQDYMGAEHLVGDTTTVKAYLEKELAQINIEELQPWYIEPCGIEGRFVRVSLRAVIEDKITATDLLNAFIASANSSSRPSVEQWTEQWHLIIQRIDSMGLSLPHYDEDKAFIEDVLAQGKYAISHSPEYRQAYSPHYRIVRRDILQQLGLEQLHL